MNKNNPYIIGIAGGTGSGKTTQARRIIHALGDASVSILEVDSYYRDLSHIPVNQRHDINFDEPAVLDTQLLKDHLTDLKQGKTIQKPCYDFSIHSRTPETEEVQPRPVMVVEGILVLAIPEISDLLDLKVFVDEAADIRLLRRINRDIRERGRTIEMITEQYIKDVRPMHELHVEPCRKIADFVISGGSGIDRIIELLEKIRF